MDMTQQNQIRFPIRLEHAFFKTLQFSRDNKIPDDLHVNIEAGIKVHHKNFPDRLQIDLRMETVDTPPVRFCVELVGMFSLIEDYPKPERDILADFVNQRALYLLLPYINQIVHIVMGQMGVKPLKVPIPYHFAFMPDKDLDDDEKA